MYVKRKMAGSCLLLIAVILVISISFPCYAAISRTNFDNNIVSFSAKEKEYLEDNPTVTIAVDTSWIPFGFSRHDGTCGGINPNILSMIAYRAGLRVKFISCNSLSEAISACSSGEAMLVGGIIDKEELKKDELIYTDSYISIGYSTITKGSISNLYIEGNRNRISICKGTYSKSQLKKRFPAYDFNELESNEKCLDEILRGNSDVSLIPSYSASFYMTFHEYRKLNAIPINNYSSELFIGANKESDPLLISILNKSIGTLASNDINEAIYEGATEATDLSKRISDYMYNNSGLLLFCLFIILLIVGALVFLLILRRRKVEEIKKEKKYIDDIKHKDLLLNSIPGGIGIFIVENEKIVDTFLNDGFYGLVEDTRKNRDNWTKRIFINGIYFEDKHFAKDAISSIISGNDKISFTYRALKADKSLTWIQADALVTSRNLPQITVYCSFSNIDQEVETRHASEAKTEFFSRMSHDMRTPMNGILGMVSLSEGETDVAVLQKNISKIKSSSEYLLCLINDTLDFQKIESGTLTLAPKMVSAKSMIESVVEMIRTTADEKGITFTVKDYTVKKDVYIMADPLRVRQVFVNLLSNAVKFTNTGGTVELTVMVTRRKGMTSHCRITITDTGIGMSREFIMNDIFKPFSQEHSSISTQYAGTGLGLSIAKKLLDLMNGTISVESELGEGTKFTVELDFERVDSKIISKVASADTARKNNAMQVLFGKNILIAEDHPLNAEIAKKMLENAGCIVTIAKNGKECVDKFAESDEYFFNAVLMDIRMPIMNGIEATKRIRTMSRKDANSIIIIAMTANAYSSDVKDCIDAGMNSHLSKPVKPLLLYEEMAELL